MPVVRPPLLSFLSRIALPFLILMGALGVDEGLLMLSCTRVAVERGHGVRQGGVLRLPPPRFVPYRTIGARASCPPRASRAPPTRRAHRTVNTPEGQ